MKLKKFNIIDDIYYSKEYASLYLKEGDELFLFEYREGVDFFINLSIKKPINRVGDLVIDDGYYDLETAYGYGGYYSTTKDVGFLLRSFNAYQKKCLDEKIIAEFVRFHPYNDMPMVCPSCFKFLVFDRETVSIDLSLTKQERWGNYSATTRNILRRSSNELSIQPSVDIDAFMRLYQLTMKRNKADFSYYFKKEYYEKLLLLNNVKLFALMHNNSIVNMSFILFGRQLVHYHLSANNDEYSRLNGNYYLLDAVCDYVNINYPEIIRFHLGGGRSVDPCDSLLAFKLKFSKIRNRYYIAGNIFNMEKYHSYVELFHNRYPEYIPIKYFLKYRLASS